MARVLITGVAGLLGGEAAAALASAGHGVIGLVRNGREVRHGEGETVETGAWRGAPPASGAVLLVEGDVARPDLGLSEADYRRLAEQCDCVLHCAAVTAFDADPALYDSVNVAGTRHMLDFARARPGEPAGFVHVSTAYVCGEAEGAIEERLAPRPAAFVNGYEASKFDAEQAVAAAMEAGQPAAIARPSVIVGRADDGAIAGFDTIYAAFKLLAEGRIGTIPARPGATLDFVPVDHVVAGLVAMVERFDRAAGKVFHLVAGAPMPVADFFALIAAYPQFAEPALVAPERFEADALPRRERRLHRRVAPLYASYFQRDLRFAQDNARELIGRSAPPADTGLMGRQIDFAIRAGFLRAAPVPA